VRGDVERDRIDLFSACLPGWDSRRVIDVAVSFGFSAIEWAIGPGHAIERPQVVPELRELCDCAGLRSGGLLVQDPAVTLAAPKRAAAYVDLAIALGASYLRLFAPRYRGGLLEREQHRARAGLDFLVDLAAPAGLTVLVETSPTTLAPAPDFAAALVEQHPPERAGVLYDPGNMAIEGCLAPRLAIARLGAHLHHVHVKNVAWSRRAGVWRWRHAELAKGMLDWREILAALAAARYDGRFSIDHLGGVPTPALLRAESGHLRELVAQVSARRAAPDRGVRAKGVAKSPLSV
jgi:sugar phosphate isomerase/epimerase